MRNNSKPGKSNSGKKKRNPTKFASTGRRKRNADRDRKTTRSEDTSKLINERFRESDTSQDKPDTKDQKPVSGTTGKPDAEKKGRKSTPFAKGKSANNSLLAALPETNSHFDTSSSLKLSGS